MKVYKAGTRIITVIGDVEAIVIGVCIREGSIEYHVRYFMNGEEKDCWLFHYEIKLAKPKTGTGFNRDRSNDNETEEQETLLIQ